MIIDYHSHIKWDRDTNQYDTAALLQDMEENQIDKRVVSALAGFSTREQNSAVAELVKANPDRIIGSAVINPKERGCVEEMERIAASGYFKTIELDSMEHCYYPETMPVLDTIIEIAAANHMPVNVFTGWGCRTMPAQWAYYAKRHPDMTMVLLHMGTTDFGYGCVELVPQYENLMVETSCMYEFPILRKAFSQIPKERFLFGSHYPDKLTVCSVHTFDLLQLPEELKECMFCKNAERLLSCFSKAGGGTAK